MKKINHVRSPLGQHCGNVPWLGQVDAKVLVRPSISLDILHDGFFLCVGTDYFLRFISDILFLDNSVCRYVCLYVLICF